MRCKESWFLKKIFKSEEHDKINPEAGTERQKDHMWLKTFQLIIKTKLLISAYPDLQS